MEAYLLVGFYDERYYHEIVAAAVSDRSIDLPSYTFDRREGSRRLFGLNTDISFPSSVIKIGHTFELPCPTSVAD